MTDSTDIRTRRAIDVIAEGNTRGDTIATGFPSVDNALGGGLRRGDLVVIGGEAGSGKSALALGIAMRAAVSGAAVHVLSGEMEPARVVERAMAIEARVRVDDLRRGTVDDDGRARLATAARALDRHRPRIGTIDVAGLSGLDDTLGDTETDLIVIDPLQSLATGARTLDEDLVVAVRALKRLALDRDVCVLATSHVPALDGTRKDPRPQLDDFAALGAVKQCADVVLGIYRQEMYDSAPDVDGATELIVLKNRNGPRGYVDLYFYKQWMRFEDVLEPER